MLDGYGWFSMMIRFARVTTIGTSASAYSKKSWFYYKTAGKDKTKGYEYDLGKHLLHHMLQYISLFSVDFDMVWLLFVECLDAKQIKSSVPKKRKLL